MIISHEHRYLFIELPHTGSTAISHELDEHYAGEPILWKHAYYHEFLAGASANERRSYYSPKVIFRACFAYGSFMQKWGYTFPPEWGQITIPLLGKIFFEILSHYRDFKRRYLLRCVHLRRKQAWDHGFDRTK